MSNVLFPERLKSLRLEKSMSRATLADTLGVSVRMVSYWENGERECTFEMLWGIAEYLGVSTDYVLWRKGY